MSMDKYRKCAKCGKSRADDMTVSFHRFPNPGFTNKIKASSWAKYCFPTEDWTSLDFLKSLYRKNKVLCGRHFHSSKFYDNMRQKLSKFAVPDSDEVEELLSNKEILFTQHEQQAIGPSQSHSRSPLHSFTSPYYPNEDRFAKWKSILNEDVIRKGDEYIHRNVRLCEKHFESKFKTRGRRLTLNSYPTLHLYGDENSSSRANIPETSPSPDPLEDNAPFTEDTLVTEDDQTNDDIETIEKETFSWQKANQICLDDEDEICENTVATETKVKESETNIGLELKYWECEEKKSDKENSNHKEYVCNNCSKSIVGFRYTCVECENYDLCLECEMNMTHPEHCMLRIPKPSPAGEIQSILEAIRDKMRSLSEELEQNQLALEEVKVEVDLEDAADTDPLTSPLTGAPHEAEDTTVDSKYAITAPSVARQTAITAPSVARQTATDSKPVGTLMQPETVPATKTPLIRLKKLKLTDIDGNNPKGQSKRRKLSRQVEEDFEQECLEETWLDEDILEEDNIIIIDVEEAPSGSHTSSTLKRKLNVRQAHTASSGPS